MKYNQQFPCHILFLHRYKRCNRLRFGHFEGCKICTVELLFFFDEIIPAPNPMEHPEGFSLSKDWHCTDSLIDPDGDRRVEGSRGPVIH
jgi:hypothetical protein